MQTELDYIQQMHSTELSKLQKCFDFSEFARARINERVPPKASSLEKTAAIAKMSAETLKWLLEDAHEHYEIIHRRAQGESVSPFHASSWPLYPQYWTYQVTKAILLLDQYPLDSKGFDSLAPNRKQNPDFKQYWPKTPAATAFNGVGLSVAEAISEALKIFLKKCHLLDFPKLPNGDAFPDDYDFSDMEDIVSEFNKNGNLLPLVGEFRNLYCFHAAIYLPPDKWTSGEIEKEYSRVICLIDHETEQAISHAQDENNSKDMPSKSMSSVMAEKRVGKDPAMAPIEPAKAETAADKGIKKAVYNGQILTVYAASGRKLKFSLLDPHGNFRGAPLQTLRAHNQLPGLYIGDPAIKPEPGDSIVITPADEPITRDGEEVTREGQKVVTEGDSIPVEFQESLQLGQKLAETLKNVNLAGEKPKNTEDRCTSMSGSEQCIIDFKHCAICEGKLKDALNTGDVATVVSILIEDIVFWTKHLKENFINILKIYDTPHKNMFAYGLIPSPLARSFIGSYELYDLLAFHKSVEYAKEYSSKIDSFLASRKEFINLAIELLGKYKSSGELELFVIADEKRKELEHCVCSLIDYLNVLYLMLRPKNHTQEADISPIATMNNKNDENEQENNDSKIQKEITPLSPNARAIYDKLCSLKPTEAMTLPAIQDWWYEMKEKNLDEGTFKKYRKELLPYGLKNKPRVGYYIEK